MFWGARASRVPAMAFLAIANFHSAFHFPRCDGNLRIDRFGATPKSARDACATLMARIRHRLFAASITCCASIPSSFITSGPGALRPNSMQADDLAVETHVLVPQIRDARFDRHAFTACAGSTSSR